MQDSVVSRFACNVQNDSVVAHGCAHLMVTAGGTHTLEFRVTDNAGNASPVQTLSFTIKT